MKAYIKTDPENQTPQIPRHPTHQTPAALAHSLEKEESLGKRLEIKNLSYLWKVILAKIY